MSISENMLLRVLTGMGINVPEVMKLFELIGLTMRDFQNEKASFKRASGDVVNEFRHRFDNLEKTVLDIHLMLARMELSAMPDAPVKHIVFDPDAPVINGQSLISTEEQPNV